LAAPAGITSFCGHRPKEPIVAKDTSKKVGGTATADPKGKKGKKAKKAKKVYDFSSCVNTDGESIVNDDGKLTGVPVAIPAAEEGGDPVQVGFDPAAHKPLVKDDFADSATYMDFRAYMCDMQIARKTELAKVLRKKAAKLRKYGDEKTRKRVMRLDRMKEQMAALQAELEAEGFELEDDDDE
jgi:hypothetical protein